MNHLKDEQLLVKKIINGKLRAFNELITNYQRLVASIVFRMVPNNHDREEICQEIFIKVYQNLASFQFKSRLSTWIGRIAYNTSINFIRKEKIPTYSDITLIGENKDNIMSDYPESIHSSISTPDTLLEKKDQSERLKELINQLPEIYKTVLFLYHIEDLSYKEISEIIGAPEGTVKSHIYRARNLLKEKVVAEHEGEELWQ